MKTFIQFIDEAKQVGTIYHFTKPSGLHSMLFFKHNEQLAGTNMLMVSGHNGVISTTRNHNLANISTPNNASTNIHLSKGYSVRISLDGNKISEHYKIKPILGFKDNDPDIHNVSLGHRVSRHDQEREEVIHADWLPLKPYVKRIDFIHHEDLTPELHKKIAEELDLHGIPHSIGDKWVKHE